MTISLITPQYLLQQNYSLIYSGTNPEVHGEPSPGIAHFPKEGMDGWRDVTDMAESEPENAALYKCSQSPAKELLSCTQGAPQLQRDKLMPRQKNTHWKEQLLCPAPRLEKHLH